MIENFYGFLQFFQENMLLISNHLGIIRGLCIDKKISDIDFLRPERKSKLTNINVFDYWKPKYQKSQFMRFLLQGRQIDKKTINYHEQSSFNPEEKKFYEIFGYPSHFIENLAIMNDEERLRLIQNCIVRGKLFVLNEENNIEMYNLLSRNMDMLYHHSRFQVKFTNNKFAISKNAKWLAVTIDDNSIALLYLNENSLNVANKKFTNPSTIHAKITYMAFSDDDENLLLLKEDQKQNYLMIWNIFESSESNPDKLYSFDKKLKSININELLDNKNLSEFEQKTLEIKEINSKEIEVSEKIADKDVVDTEPWFYSDHHQISHWLDHNKTTRISFGFYTIQIWKNNEITFIWSANYNNNNYYDLSKNVPTQNIESLDISRDNIIKFKCNGDEYEFHVNKLVDNSFTKDHAVGACNALIFFHKLKMSEMPNKQLKVNEFIERTKDIIRNILINEPDLWRLLDIRYNLMENLIRSQSNDIIKLILKKDDDYLHIPQIFEWNGKKKLEDELLIALKNDNIEIIQNMLNYYSTNAMENTGWMWNLSQALPEINERFKESIMKLFKKPIFYQKPIHLSKSIIKSKLLTKPSITTFTVDTRLPILVSEEEYKNRFSKRIPSRLFNNSNDDIIINMTPLPDFNRLIIVKSNDKVVTNSPLIKFFTQKNSNTIYDNLTIEAIINFNWEAYASKLTYLILIFYLFRFYYYNYIFSYSK